MENEKKKKVYIFIFPVAGTNEKKNNEKKKICCRIGWATAQIVLQEGGRFGWVALYCNIRIVLQEVWLGAGRWRSARGPQAGRAGCRSGAQALGAGARGVRGAQARGTGRAGGGARGHWARGCWASGRAGERHDMLAGHCDTAASAATRLGGPGHNTARPAHDTAARARPCAV